jgi:steroid 5-alpha reductase family enzyme
MKIYLSTNPLITAFAFSLFLFPIFLIASEINKNYSQIDRFWSLLPTIYNAHFVTYAHLLGLPTKRLDLLLAVSTLWSLRLTFNYWRKGGYSIGSEDYRWAILREKISPPLFFIFNVLFISLAQSILLMSITTPTYLLLLTSKFTGDHLSTSDLVVPSAIAGCVALEWLADQQQWNFQHAKKSYQNTGKAPREYKHSDLDRGFLTDGLFAWSRHPNFAAEQAIWILFYQWSCLATGSLYNWSVLGVFSYIILFRASTALTESISAGKYPGYKEYQKRVGMFWPRLLG